MLLNNAKTAITFTTFLLLLWAPTIAMAQQCQITRPSLIGKNGEASTITSAYGMRTHPISGTQKMHTGTDISTPGASDCNQPVLQQAGCQFKEYVKDKYPGQLKGYGNQLKLDCGNGTVLTYSHLNSYNEATGIMYVGTTGSSTGCHLHYEAFIDEKRVDPECLWGTGKNCPANTGSGNTSITNICEPDQRDALKDHPSSINGDPGGANPGEHDDHDHDNEETDDHGDVTSTLEGGGDSDDDPLEEPQPDPEEEEPEEPDPGEEYDPKASTPVCENSTCISQDMIDNAKHLRVDDDKVDTHMKYITAKGKCEDPIETGITVRRQKPGKLVEYPDAFCTNVGCTYQNDGSGKGKCE